MNELRRREDFLGGCWQAVFTCARCGELPGVVLPDRGPLAPAEAADAGWLRGPDGRLVCPACQAR